MRNCFFQIAPILLCKRCSIVCFIICSYIFVFVQQEEVSANAVRLGLVEKKLENASRDGEDKVRKVERELSAQQEVLKKKEK